MCLILETWRYLVVCCGVSEVCQYMLHLIRCALLWLRRDRSLPIYFRITCPGGSYDCPCVSEVNHEEITKWELQCNNKKAEQNMSCVIYYILCDILYFMWYVIFYVILFCVIYYIICDILYISWGILYILGYSIFHGIFDGIYILYFMWYIVFFVTTFYEIYSIFHGKYCTWTNDDFCGMALFTKIASLPGRNYLHFTLA